MVFQIRLAAPGDSSFGGVGHDVGKIAAGKSQRRSADSRFDRDKKGPLDAAHAGAHHRNFLRIEFRTRLDPIHDPAVIDHGLPKIDVDEVGVRIIEIFWPFLSMNDDCGEIVLHKIFREVPL